MAAADVYAQIERMGQLPSLPRTLLRIQEVVQDDRSSADDLAECILRDQSLTMRVLRVVNSAMYRTGNRDEVRTVSTAVVRLGFETVRRLALGLSVFDMMSKLSRSPWLAEIARHSLLTAGFAQALAEASGRLPSEEAVVMALVHDVGKVVLLECSPAAMDEVLRETAAGREHIDAEREHFGLTHTRAGRRLAVRWQLPLELQQVIGDHHDIDPLRPPSRLEPGLAIIAYADALAGLAGDEDAAAARAGLVDRVGRLLGIPAPLRGDIEPTAVAIIRELGRMLGVATGDLRAYGSLVNVDGGAVVAPPTVSPAELAERTARQLALYRAVGAGIAAGAPADELLDRILAGAVEILGFERVVLLRADRRARRLRPRLWAGPGAGELAPRLELPLSLATGALALAVLERRLLHVPRAASPAYGDLAGSEVLAAARCRGFVAAPVLTPESCPAVIYADVGPDGPDVAAEQASELAGLAQQAGLVLGTPQPTAVG